MRTGYADEVGRASRQKAGPVRGSPCISGVLWVVKNVKYRVRVDKK